MTSIQLLGGKQKLLTIQVSNFVHLQSLINWARLLKKNAGFTVALLTSLCVLVFLFTQFRINSRNPPPSNTGELAKFARSVEKYQFSVGMICIPLYILNGACKLYEAVCVCRALSSNSICGATGVVNQFLTRKFLEFFSPAQLTRVGQSQVWYGEHSNFLCGV